MSETQLAIHDVEIDHLKEQQKRFQSHLESEQRVYGGHGKRLDYQEKWIDRIQSEVDKHDKMLLNSGEGLALKIDRVIQKEELRDKAEKNFQWTFSNVVAILAMVISAIIAILQFMKP